MEPLSISLALMIPAILSLGIPALTELLTKVYAPDWIKSSIVIALSLLAGVIGTVPTGALELGGLPAVGTYLLSVFVAWVGAGRAYLAGMANKAVTVAPDSGLGPNLPVVQDEEGMH